ncbi:hypothetical protein J2046_001802 [Rhizobium petrolearium]|uniref:hypothetical protein n=1 Tax=Neorhizobium petrolearium TaxID=515361 RepID=UPI001AE8DDCA|nr:hypothetical protein [Neorhizobium petrolearium]MBP1843546.1 hypothetical protein [Neorhizobium petrolearium]
MPQGLDIKALSGRGGTEGGACRHAPHAAVAGHSLRAEIYTSQRLNPFLPFVDPDLARLPFVRGCRHTLAWHVENLATRLGLYRSPMRVIGKVRPRQPSS